MQDRGADAVEVGLHPVEHIARAAAHDGQRPVDRARLHAGDRRVQERHPRGLQRPADLDGGPVADGAEVHDRLAPTQVLDDAALAGQDRPHDLRVGKAQEKDVGVRQLGGVRGAARPPVPQRRDPAFVAVADDQLRSALQQVERDGTAHLTQSNKAKFHFLFSCSDQVVDYSMHTGLPVRIPSPMRFSRCACG